MKKRFERADIMRTLIHRLSLGCVLIALSSAVLLMSDLRQRKGAGGRIRRVAIVQSAGNNSCCFPTD
jgi:hypothetical protein